MRKGIGRGSWVALAIFFLARLSLACTGICSQDIDCSGVSNPCAYCDTTFGRCANCCTFNDVNSCPSGCTWDAGTSQCRNYSATSCGGATVPELPSRFRRYFPYACLLIFTFVSAWALGRRSKKSPPPSPPAAS